MAILTCFLSISTSTIAYGFACRGKVSYIGIGANGDLNVEIVGTSLNVICNLKSQGGFAFDAQTCRSVQANLLAAQALEKNVTIFYYDEAYTCSTISTWSQMTSAYFLLGPD
jgi:hypothetical protein